MLERLPRLCREWSEGRRVVASFLTGAHVWYGATERLHLFLILDRLDRGIRYERRALEGTPVSILKIDRVVFEEDLKRAFLGGFLREHLVSPYRALSGERFLLRSDRFLKRKIVENALTNLALEYLEMASEILISKEYFLFDYIARRSRIHPSLGRHYTSLLRGPLARENREKMLASFEPVLRELVRDGILTPRGDHLTLAEKFVERALSRKPSILKLLPSLLQRYFKLRILQPALYREALRMLEDEITWSRKTVELEEPKDYLFIPAERGLMSLREERVIEKLVRTAEGASVEVSIKKYPVSGISSALNTLYVATLRTEKGERRVLVKKFSDWAGLKWFPAALYAAGLQEFITSARHRMSREYKFNRILKRNGFRVPEILGLDWMGELLVEEFVEGVPLSQVAWKASSSGALDESDKSLVEAAGRLLAKLHAMGITMGDCKPENFIATGGGELYVVDLEQARKGGDASWDLAEFLYFSAFYGGPTGLAEGVGKFVSAFIKGYLEGGGSPAALRKASQPKYLRALAPIVPPQALSKIISLLRSC